MVGVWFAVGIWFVVGVLVCEVSRREVYTRRHGIAEAKSTSTWCITRTLPLSPSPAPFPLSFFHLTSTANSALARTSSSDWTTGTEREASST